MFRRLLVEDWQRLLSALSVLLFFTVFVVNFLRVRRLSRDTIAHMENLPLASDDHD